MRLVLTTMLVMALPALAADSPPGCAWLCGNWALDTDKSEALDPLLDEALQKYDDPEPQKRRTGSDDPKSLRPVGELETGTDRPFRDQLRKELVELLASPATLKLAEDGQEILISADAGPARRYTADEESTRVDDYGEAEIRTEWRSDDSLEVSEKHNRRHNQTVNYALRPDGTLAITREAERPGLKRIRIRSVYRRD